jgi:hypothetical protein
MYREKHYLLNLAMLACLSSGVSGIAVDARPVNTDEGQAQIMQQINAGQKSNQLTVKEANKLRKNLAQVIRRKAKMISKTGRKLTDEARTDIKKDLNDISNEIHKLELEKRVTSR